MFYVYSGYVSPDNDDSSEGPTYSMKEFISKEEVVAARKEFQESICDDCSYVIFRVFEGIERRLVPKNVVETYGFSDLTRG